MFRSGATKADFEPKETFLGDDFVQLCGRPDSHSSGSTTSISSGKQWTGLGVRPGHPLHGFVPYPHPHLRTNHARSAGYPFAKTTSTTTAEY